MAGYLLKASAADFDRWRAASRQAGFPSLAAFLRAGADALAAEPGNPAFPQPAKADVVRMLRDHGIVSSGSSFRPDPRPTPVRRKSR